MGSGHNISYVELDVSTNFSFLHGGSHAEELVERAGAHGYSAIGIADTNTMAGVVRAYGAGKKIGVTVFTGSRLALLNKLPAHNEAKPTIPSELPLSLIAYPTSKASYGRLCALLTRGKFRAQKGQCFLTLEDLFDFSEGLHVIINIENTSDASVPILLAQLRAHFTKDFLSLGISHHYGPRSARDRSRVIKFSKEFEMPLLATNRVLYHGPERRALQDVLTCIRRGCTLETAGFSLLANAERHLKSPEEMCRLFRHLPDALTRSVFISEQLKGFSLGELRYEYPREICPDGRSPQEYLTEITWQTAARRYPTGIPEKVRTTLEHELNLINELHYAKYFLTVYDIVAFARRQGILCQGRGAAANSAVCYCLGITSVDPDKINLLFERFVSKERNEPPDIDIDFEHERREEVIQYIYNKYGRTRAALVAEVISYRTRSAFRDVGKAFGMQLEDTTRLTKLVLRSEDGIVPPEKLLKSGFSVSDKRILLILKISETLQSFPRHLSQHVGGFIICEGQLSELVPIENARMPDRSVIEWDKDDVEEMGMLKIDCLGLGMLTCIRKGLEFLNAEKNTSVGLNNVPPEDPKVYDMICEADTIGVFQIESRAQMSMLPRLRPRCFYDLVIQVAIVRPGPIVGGMVHPFLKRRMGREKVTYPDDRVRGVLESTLGVPIFQEQVMQLAIVAAGFTPGEADNLRRAMASWKRKQGVMEQFGKRISEGMLKNGYSLEFALRYIEQIRGFSEYGFPQSHAASFALLVYVSSWIKKHHPAAFAAALLNSQPMGFYQPSQIMQDAERHGVTVKGVDVNRSDWDCTLEYSDKNFTEHAERKTGGPILRLGMRQISGLRESEAKKVVHAVKQHGPFSSLLSLWRTSGVRVHTLRTLAHADAFSSLGLHRQAALWHIRKFRDDPLPLLENIRDFEESVQLRPFTPEEEVFRDYGATGHSLKEHPFTFVRSRLSSRNIICAHDVKYSKNLRSGKSLSVAGMVLIRQRPHTASGILFMTLEDETGVVNLIVKPQIFHEYRDVLSDATFLLVHGTLQRKDQVTHVLVQSAEDIGEMFHGEGLASRDFR